MLVCEKHKIDRKTKKCFSDHDTAYGSEDYLTDDNEAESIKGSIHDDDSDDVIEEHSEHSSKSNALSGDESHKEEDDDHGSHDEHEHEHDHNFNLNLVFYFVGKNRN